MTRVRVASFSISVDGYGAGPDQTLKTPLGVGGEELHEWLIPTNTFQKMSNRDGTTGVDDDFAKRGFQNIGAWILGRNMFTASRGPWPDDNWKGWWGENPPYHAPVFVLTHHPRKSIAMKGDTTFHFVTEGMRAALDRAREAANGKDIRIVGGVSVIRQYFEAKLIDEAHIAVSPILLGAGELLFAGLDLRALGYRLAEHVTTPNAMHVVLART
jgi:dihydrofolate reductase